MGAECELLQSVVNSAKSFDDRDIMKAWRDHLEKKLQFFLRELYLSIREEVP